MTNYRGSAKARARGDLIRAFDGSAVTLLLGEATAERDAGSGFSRESVFPCRPASQISLPAALVQQCLASPRLDTRINRSCSGRRISPSGRYSIASTSTKKRFILPLSFDLAA
ncbi:MAG: hypothetical protein L0H73_06450 [Nitrococcus sp.]|nr:hypothetical protein [Nitrococcus sp.]